MKWKKLGKIFNFKRIDKYLVSHASNPLAVQLKGDVYRVFYSGRNKENKSSVGYVDIDILQQKVVKNCKEACFRVSDGFYSDGVSVGNLYKCEGRNYILFMAWKVHEIEHWRGNIGRLKVSSDLGRLCLEGEEPFLTTNEEDPVSLSYPWVLYDEGIYKMWYGSTISWDSSNGEMLHVIKYATSSDGEAWTRNGLAIPYEVGVAQAFSRPSVMKDEAGYHMWFSYRSGSGQKYRIGYAHSHDGLIWDRKKTSGIDVSEFGWDSEMICYPYTFDHKGKRYMLYNGNGYGKTGFGLAVLESE